MLALRSLLFSFHGFATVVVSATAVLLTFWAPFRFHW